MKGGRTALHIACEKSYSKIATLLIDAGLDFSIPDENGYPPIINCLVECNINMIKLLVERGASLNVKNTKTGISALMAGAMLGNLEILNMCLDAHCNLHDTDIVSYFKYFKLI